jgi:hypothetical protein
MMTKILVAVAAALTLSLRRGNQMGAGIKLERGADMSVSSEPYPGRLDVEVGFPREIPMPDTRHGAARPPKARTSGQSADRADAKSLHCETAKTEDLAANTFDSGEAMTGNQGLQVSDDQHSLKAGERGPTLLEDFYLREKITHFDHERIPERVVHARGAAAHGIFQVYEDLSDLTMAGLLCDPSRKRRFSSDSRRSPVRADPPIRRETSAVLRSSSTPKREYGISSETTCRFFSSRTRSNFPTLFTP